MNAKLIEALASSNRSKIRAAIRVLSAVRGPDDENSSNKHKFTAPIRAWVFSEVEYSSAGFVPRFERVNIPATHEGWKRLHNSALTGGHYHNHIAQAIQAILFLENCVPATADNGLAC